MTGLADLAAAADSNPGAGIVMMRWREGQVERAVHGPVEADAVFELGSITKVVTGLLLGVAVDAGEVSLETPLSECVPGARSRSIVTLGALGSHAAGLPRLPLGMLLRLSPWWARDPYRDATVEELSDISLRRGSGGVAGCVTRTPVRLCWDRRSRLGLGCRSSA